MLSVKPITPNLLAQYADKFGNPDFPAPELNVNNNTILIYFQAYKEELLW